MANLDGSRSHGGKWDILAGAMLREDSAWFTDICRLLLRAARAEGIDRDRLPDFLDLEDGGELALLGQDELGTSVFESALRDQIARSMAGNEWPEQDTERIILAAARVGQHVFALNVLTNCGRPPLLETLLLPDDAERPRRRYLDWHREKSLRRLTGAAGTGTVSPSVSAGRGGQS